MTDLGFFESFDLTAPLFWVLRVAAGLGGALIGWFITGPIVRLLVRGAFHRTTPGWLLPWAKLGGAGAVGFLVYYYLMLGGIGGPGWGPGPGGAPGRGPGDGSVVAGADKAAADGKSSKAANAAQKKREALEIELIGGKRYHDDGRYYLLKRQEPPLTKEAVDDYLREHQDTLDEYVTIILTPQSVAAQHGAVLRLTGVIEKYGRNPQIKNVNP